MEDACITELMTEEEPYMSDAQVRYFRQRLLSWREAVLKKADQCDALLQQERQTRLPDLIDQSVESMSREMTLLNAQRSRRLVEQINAALVRINEGSFGYCLISGEEIGLRRLQAWPIATLAVDVQEQQERRQKMLAGW